MAFSDAVAAVDRVVQQVLGDTVRYAPARGVPPAVDVRGVFNAAYVRVDFTAGGAGVESTQPAVFLLLADLPTDPDDDEPTVTVNGVDYSVRERKKDGMGGVFLMLREIE